MIRRLAHLAPVTAFVAIIALVFSPRQVFAVSETSNEIRFKTIHFAHEFVFPKVELLNNVPELVTDIESKDESDLETLPQVEISALEISRLVVEIIPSPTPLPIVSLPPASKPVIRRVSAPSSTPADVQVFIDRYAAEYGADPTKMAIIAKCESGFRADAVSPSGAYVGLYQFVGATWASNRRVMGLDPHLDLRANAEEAVRTAAFKMGRDGYGAWPVCGGR